MLYSLTKSFNFSGIRGGYLIVLNEQLRKEVEFNFRQYLELTNMFSPVAVIAACENG